MAVTQRPGGPSGRLAGDMAAKRPFCLRLTRGWAWALAGAAMVAAALRAPVVSADVRTMTAHGLHLAWLGAAAAAVVLSLAGLMVAQRQLLSAVVVYRVAGYWAPGGAGTIVAAVLARRGPAPAATGGKGGDAHARVRQ